MKPFATARTLCCIDPQHLTQPLLGSRCWRQRLRCDGAQQLANLCQLGRFVTVSQKPVVPNPHEAFGQDMHQEAAHELVCRELGFFAAISIGAVAITERHLAAGTVH